MVCPHFRRCCDEWVALAFFPAFAPSSSKVAVRFLVSLYLLSRIGPNCTCIQLFLAPYSFFVFCC